MLDKVRSALYNRENAGRTLSRKGGEDMTDTRLLKSKMVLADITTKEIADATGLRREAIQKKLRGVTEFSLEQAQAVRKLLNLTDDEFEEIFFSK